jgi:hypothetical protein
MGVGGSRVASGIQSPNTLDYDGASGEIKRSPK